MHTVKFNKVHDNARLPLKAHATDAGSDIYAVEQTQILPWAVKQVATGLKVAYIPSGHKIEVYGRSGFSKKGYLIANAPGQVDETFRGELGILVYNSTSSLLTIEVGDRIAQISLEAVIPVEYEFSDETTETARGEGGFGSTGR